MAFSGGVYTLPGPALNTGEIVSATENNQFRNDVATAFNLTFLRNGTSTAAANLPMGGYKLTGLGVATTSGDALSYGQAANVTTITISSDATLSGGTANGVAYLNGSKVLTTGSALTFDGTNLGVGTAATDTNSYGRAVDAIGTNGAAYYARNVGSNTVGFFGAYYGAFNSVNLGSTTNSDVVFYRQNSEQMRLTSTGLGIGTSSPNERLTINSASASSARIGIQYSGSAIAYLGSYSGVVGSGNATDMLIGAANALAFASGGAGTERMRLDSSGNLGLGVTPSAWFTGSSVFQFGATGSVWNNGSNNSAFAHNMRFTDSDARYLQNGLASYYAQTSGQHFWYTAPSGTAGNAISFTQAMTLDASGRLGLGVTSPAAMLNLGSGGAIQLNRPDNATYSAIYRSASGTIFNDANSDGFMWQLGGSERMRIDSSGGLLLGTTTAYGGSIAGGLQTKTSGAGEQNWTCWNSATSGTRWYAYFGTGSTFTATGSITSNGTSTTYGTSSDYRLKENIQPMQNALGVVQQLNPVTYTWKADGSYGQGFIAHELQTIIPECVVGEKDAVDAEGKPVYQGIDTSFLVATLCKAIQELEARVKQLEGK